MERDLDEMCPTPPNPWWCCAVSMSKGRGCQQRREMRLSCLWREIYLDEMFPTPPNYCAVCVAWARARPPPFPPRLGAKMMNFEICSRGCYIISIISPVVNSYERYGESGGGKTKTPQTAPGICFFFAQKIGVVHLPLCPKI